MGGVEGVSFAADETVSLLLAVLPMILIWGVAFRLLIGAGFIEGIFDGIASLFSGIWYLATIRTRRQEEKAMRGSEIEDRMEYARWLDSEALRVEVDARLENGDPGPALRVLNDAADANSQKLAQLQKGGKLSKAGEFMFEKQKLREKLGSKKDQAPRESCR